MAEGATQQAESAKEIAKAADSQAQSAEITANAAKKIAKKADIKGWIALLFSGITLLFEFAVHHEKIIEFFKQILQLIAS